MAAEGNVSSLSNKLSYDELNSLNEAFKCDKFRKLFDDFICEFSDPSKQKQYESELKQYEKEQGVDVVFIEPTPGLALVGDQVDGQGKVFINIGVCNLVEKPTYEAVYDGSKRGINWHLPHVMPKPRVEPKLEENGGKSAMVYDVIVHSETTHLAKRNKQVRDMLVDISLKSLSEKYNFKAQNVTELGVDKYVGKPVKSVVRKVFNENLYNDSKKEIYNDLDEDVDSISNLPVFKEDCSDKISEPKTPVYKIKHIDNLDLQDFTQGQNDFVKVLRPKYLGIDIQLPGINRASNIDVEVLQQKLELSTICNPKYKLNISLPYPVDDNTSVAKFHVTTKVLSLTLTVIELSVKQSTVISQSPSADSGIECDIGYRTSSDGDNSSVSSQEEENNVKNNKEKLTKDERPSTVEGRSGVITKDPLQGQFLEERTILPSSYTIHQTLTYLVLTIDCGNVIPESIQIEVIDENKVNLKYNSIGGGLTRLCYGLSLSSNTLNSTLKAATYELDNDNTMSLSIQKMTSDAWNSCLIGVPKNLQVVYLNPPIDAIEDNVGKEQFLDLHVEATIDNTRLPVSTSKVCEEQKDDLRTISEPLGVNFGRQCRGRTLSESGSSDSKGFLSRTTSWPRGILKQRTRSLSESNLETSFPGWSSLGSSIDLDDVHENDDEDEDNLVLIDSSCSSLKKSVRFNEVVSRQVFRINSSILGQRAKNQRKAAKKRRAHDRRASASEGESTNAEDDNNGDCIVSTTEEESTETDTSVDLNGTTNSVQIEPVDISSQTRIEFKLRETKNSKEGRRKNKNRKNKKIELSNNMIFQLDLEE